MIAPACVLLAQLCNPVPWVDMDAAVKAAEPVWCIALPDDRRGTRGLLIRDRLDWITYLVILGHWTSHGYSEREVMCDE